LAFQARPDGGSSVSDEVQREALGSDRAASLAFEKSGLPEGEWLAFRRRKLAEAWAAKLAAVGCDLPAEFPDVQALLLDRKVVGDMLAGVEWFLDAVLRNWPDPDAMSRIRGHDQEWWRANARRRRAALERPAHLVALPTGREPPDRCAMRGLPASTRARTWRLWFMQRGRDVTTEHPAEYAILKDAASSAEEVDAATAVLARAANEVLDQERAARAERAWREEERRRAAAAATARRRAARTVHFGHDQQKERWAYVLKRRAEGATYKTIGAEIGVTHGRASQIVAQAERRAATGRAREERKRRAWQKVAADGIRIRRISLQPIEGPHWDEVWTPEQQWIWETPVPR
jgi:hypothetical protein